jgi:hypothetical protein
MTAPKLKAVNSLFLVCFLAWLLVIAYVCLANARLTNMIQFNSFFFQTLFLGSTIITSVMGLIIGLNYLGLKIPSVRQVTVLKKAGANTLSSQVDCPLAFFELNSGVICLGTETQRERERK